MSLEIIADNPGIDGDRISLNIIEVFGGGGCAVTVDTYDFNRYVITVTMGFNFATGNNVDWATAAAAINSAAGAFLTAVGTSGDYSNDVVGTGMSGGAQGANAGQYYSPGVVVPISKRKLPQFIKGRFGGNGIQ
jgi:hypothetical protein